MYKVLIIEDDAMVGDMVSMYLGEEGFHVIRKENGEEGIALLNSLTRYYFVGSMLPDIDGLELCRQIRGNIKCTYHDSFDEK